MNLANYVWAGNKFQSKNYGMFTIINNNGNNDIDIRFDDTGYTTSTTSGQVRSGKVKDRFVPSVYGIGIIGDMITKIEGTEMKSYTRWRAIVKRCYEGYADLHKQWYYYENFHKWYCIHVVGDYEIDKDLFSGKNKIYGPDTCVFLPNKINSAIAIGGTVGYTLSHGKYQVRIRNIDDGTRMCFGSFDTKEEAQSIYKKEKEGYIKYLANVFNQQGMICPKIYNKLLEWRVEID
jgi:hypothetical protein